MLAAAERSRTTDVCEETEGPGRHVNSALEKKNQKNMPSGGFDQKRHAEREARPCMNGMSVRNRVRAQKLLLCRTGAAFAIVDASKG